MSERIQMRVMGLSYSQIQHGAYALILTEVDGPVKMPIIIGAPEAQSVAMRMEGVTPPRPFTHDLFVSFAHGFGVTLKEVFINKFEDGLFFCELTFTDGEREIVLEARTSDAIAIAMRTKSPIYTTREILEETGFVMENDPTRTSEGDDGNAASDDTDDDTDTIVAPDAPLTHPSNPKLENYALAELEKMLSELIDKEQYEEAARVSEIIRRKREGK